MSKTSTVRARIEPAMKEQAETVFERTCVHADSFRG